ncbi:MAG: mechanosensitive ion channel [bacterium]|nr:mechanosensitive ion channel [bacterium]
MKYWLGIYDELQPNVNIQLTQIDVYTHKADTRINSLKIETEKFKKVYTKLEFLDNAQKIGEKRITQNLYSTGYFAYLNYQLSLDDGQALLKDLKHSISIIDSFQFSLLKIRSKVKFEQKASIEISQYLARIKTLHKKLQNQHTKLETVIKSGSALNSSMNKFITLLANKLSNTFMKSFFLYFNVLNPKWIAEIPQNLKYWTLTLPNNLVYEFPNTLHQWYKVFILYITTLFFILLLYFFIIKRYLRSISMSLFYQIAFFIFVIDAWMVATILLSPRIVGGFFEIAVIGTLYSIVLLSRLLTKKTSRFFRLQKINASSIFLIFIIGTLCFLFEIPQSLACILWLATLVIFLFSMTIQIRYKKFNLKTKIALRVGNSTAIILLICVFLGYLQLSMLIGMTFIVTCALFYLATAATSNIKYTQYKRNKKQPAIRSILIQGFGIPIIWCLLLILGIIWFSTRLGFNIFYDIQLFYNTSIFFFGHKIFIRNISLLVFLFFVFKNALTATRSYMKMRINSEDPESINKIAHIHFIHLVGWFIFILIIFSFFNIYIRNLIYILSGLSLGIGFGFKPIVENIVGGITLWIDKSIKIGDIVEFENEFGVVIHIGLRCTRLRTEEQSYVTWPNNMLTNKKLTNWTKQGHLKFSRITVGIGCLSDVKKASKIMIDTVNSNPHVIKTPPPFVIFREFGKSSLVFDVNFCHHITNELDSIFHESQIRYNLNSKLRNAGIEIPYQQFDINVKHEEKTNIK